MEPQLSPLLWLRSSLVVLDYFLGHVRCIFESNRRFRSYTLGGKLDRNIRTVKSTELQMIA